jgi:hypothetical protein
MTDDGRKSESKEQPPSGRDDRLEVMSAQLESAAETLQKLVDQMRAALGHK